jgi:hypothetical protein
MIAGEANLPKVNSFLNTGFHAFDTAVIGHILQNISILRRLIVLDSNELILNKTNDLNYNAQMFQKVLLQTTIGLTSTVLVHRRC